VNYRADVQRLVANLHRVTEEAFADTVSEATRSIVEGSEITGAPGQPVDTGNLRASWIPVFASPKEATITSNAVYAPSIEDGVSYAHGGTPLTQRSPVGGFHSLKLTIAGFQRIVDVVVARRRVA
jgi:hypothetical protein